MCGDTNCHWARTYFNRTASKTLLGLEINGMRHIWITLTQQAVHSFCSTSDQSKLNVLLEAAARMSGHSPVQENATYAGQASIGGVEKLDRSIFRKVSEIFNAFVFGSEAATAAVANIPLSLQPLPPLPTPPLRMVTSLFISLEQQQQQDAVHAALKQNSQALLSDQQSSLSMLQHEPSMALDGPPPQSALVPIMHQQQPNCTSSVQQQQQTTMNSSMTQQPTALFSNMQQQQPTRAVSSTAPQARETATALPELAAFPSHFDQISDSPIAPTVLGDEGVYGMDLLEASTDHAPCPCAPRGGISPDCLSIIQEKVTKAVEMKQVVLLHQKPGFGKTMTIFKLLREGYFCMIFVPTNPLKDQVRLKFDSEFVCAV